jgi:hypothetical protein
MMVVMNVHHIMVAVKVTVPGMHIRMCHKPMIIPVNNCRCLWSAVIAFPAASLVDINRAARIDNNFRVANSSAAVNFNYRGVLGTPSPFCRYDFASLSGSSDYWTAVVISDCGWTLFSPPYQS